MNRTKLYVSVWAILVSFTLIEVLTLLAPLAHTIIVVGVISLASVKAALVASVYQHLKDEPNSIRTFPLTLLILLVVFILLALIIALPHITL
jgi:hypothetical protein